MSLHADVSESMMKANDVLQDYQALANSIEIAIETARVNGDRDTATALAAILRCISNGNAIRQVCGT
jgi:DNA-binding ferritin-like protein